MLKTPIVHFEAASTIAIVISSHEPLLVLTSDQKVIAASASFCRALEIDPATVLGKPLGEPGSGEWAMPKLACLPAATASGSAQIEAYELDLQKLDQTACNLAVNARTLDDGPKGDARLLLAVTDVTQARVQSRLKDDLVRRNAILLTEVQRRVANSLQIIASPLMQSARRVQSDEVCGHLHNAQSRVMSIAALQSQLSASTDGMVNLRTYLNQLSRSLAASMIDDPARLTIEVDVGESLVGADISVSLGLTVTELVINSLKHAFADQSLGKIVIAYHSTGHEWTLSVTDNGAGMSEGRDAPKPGLGTGLIEALAKNLQGEIETSDAGPGTAVTMRHREMAGTEPEFFSPLPGNSMASEALCSSRIRANLPSRHRSIR
ncbi:sensor histidine kinase [Hyphomonas sp.]|uniref:sensor histidine kinase n=1 Tax=Hyphomonas sp. TaxID=87 RepID=UPI0034A09D34